MTPTTLPPLTPELIEAAKAWPFLSALQWGRVQAYRDEWDYTALVGDAACRILTRALTAHRPIPMGGTKVGDLVMVCCHDTYGSSVREISRRVLSRCPWRGVLTLTGWHRSWVRVKGGAS